MNVLLKAVKVVDSHSPFNGKKVDILIQDGKIKSIKSKIVPKKDQEVIEINNMHVSPGWLDMQSNFCDPGFEHKEDIESGTEAAKAGGFTGVVLVSSTNPPIHTKSDVQYIKNKATGSIVDIYPTGSLSYQRKGSDLSEMYDMYKAGAIAFSDDKKPVNDAGLLLRALQYSQNFGGLIITHCDDPTISKDGKMNEGESSTKLGLKGIPSLAEELMVSRNIFLAEYTEAPIHIANISTKKSVELLRKAKAKNLKVTCSVNAYNLALEDSSLMDFDSNLKLNPPLRTKSDIKSLIKGIKEGTIDCITSDHRPQDIESKNVEFDYAQNGMIGLETCFSLINSNKEDLKLETIINSLSSNPRKILGLKQPTINEGEAANITLFDPTQKWTFKKNNIRSKSSNTPFIGTNFTGKALGIINKNQIHLNK